MTGKPSIYLQELMSIARKVGVGDDLVRHRFVQSLPQSISPVIASQQDLDLSRIGKMADELLPLLNHSEVHHVRSNFNSRGPTTRTTDHSSDQPSRIPIGLRPFRDGQRPNVCRGHIYYADRSRTCKPWCRWDNKAQCKVLPNSRAASPIRSASPSRNSQSETGN